MIFVSHAKHFAGVGSTAPLHLIVATIRMEYEWDKGKADANRLKHGVGFEEMSDFDWETVLTFADVRKDYGEARLQSYGLIRGRLHILIHTGRDGRCRVIGLRRANERERQFYDQET